MRHRFCQWRTHDGRPGRSIPRPVRNWVVETGSLTAALRHRCGGGFHVRVLGQGWRRPALDEAWRLQLDHRRLAWIREVALCCGETPLIAARTVIPAASLAGGNDGLRRLGSRPLGELLFQGGGTRRDPLEVARLRRDDWLADRMRRLGLSSARDCWARRVVHYLNGRPLLVAELFLPELLPCRV